MHPRSILKPLPSPDVGTTPPTKRSSLKAGHVRFPPQQQLAATYYAHPASYYDRSAIVVTPNECALPRRHCPDRTYVLSESRGEARLLRHMDSVGAQVDNEGDPEEEETRHGYASNQYSRRDYFSSSSPSYAPSPSRVPDLTWSESDESDGILSPLGEILSSSRPQVVSPTMYSGRDSSRRSPTSSSFLPHALPPAHQRKRSPSPRERQRKERTYSSSESDCQHQAPPRRPRPHRSSAFIPEVPPDHGCLGGF